MNKYFPFPADKNRREYLTRVLGENLDQCEHLLGIYRDLMDVRAPTRADEPEMNFQVNANVVRNILRDHPDKLSSSDVAEFESRLGKVEQHFNSSRLSLPNLKRLLRKYNLMADHGKYDRAWRVMERVAEEFTRNPCPIPYEKVRETIFEALGVPYQPLPEESRVNKPQDVQDLLAKAVDFSFEA